MVYTQLSGTVYKRLQFGQAVMQLQKPAQTSSSSKNAGPSLRASKMLRIFRSLGRTCNVFLTKMNALPPVTDYKNSLSELHQVHDAPES